MSPRPRGATGWLSPRDVVAFGKGFRKLLAAERARYQREREIWATRKHEHAEQVERLKLEREQLRTERDSAHRRLDEPEAVPK